MFREFERQIWRSMAIPQPMFRYIELHPRVTERLETGVTAKTAATVVSDKDDFQLTVNVQDFAPDEISVKTIDNTIIVEGKHEERQDNEGFITRHFTRQFILPTNYDIKNVVSQLSPHGVLTVKAPPMVKAVEDAKIRVVPIQRTEATQAEEAGTTTKDNDNASSNQHN